LSEMSPVTLKIYDVTGRLVRVLVDEELSPGLHSGVRWDGRDDGGNPVAAGVYLYQLASPTRIDTKKIVLLR